MQAFFARAQIQNGHRRHLKKITFEPEQLESSMNILFPLNQPQEWSRDWGLFKISGFTVFYCFPAKDFIMVLLTVNH